MQNKLWQLTAGAVVVMGLAGCSTMSSMTDKVSQSWDKTWSSLSGKSASTKPAQVSQSGSCGRAHRAQAQHADGALAGPL